MFKKTAYLVGGGTPCLQIITHVAHLLSQPCKFCFFLRFNIRRYFHHHGYSTAPIQPALTQHPLRCMFLVCTMRWTLGRCTMSMRCTWCTISWRSWHHTYVCVPIPNATHDPVATTIHYLFHLPSPILHPRPQIRLPLFLLSSPQCSVFSQVWIPKISNQLILPSNVTPAIQVRFLQWHLIHAQFSQICTRTHMCARHKNGDVHLWAWRALGDQDLWWLELEPADTREHL